MLQYQVIQTSKIKRESRVSKTKYLLTFHFDDFRLNMRLYSFGSHAFRMSQVRKLNDRDKKYAAFSDRPQTNRSHMNSSVLLGNWYSNTNTRKTKAPAASAQAPTSDYLLKLYWVRWNVKHVTTHTWLTSAQHSWLMGVEWISLAVYESSSCPLIPGTGKSET